MGPVVGAVISIHEPSEASRMPAAPPVKTVRGRGV
jgi:hypothetical protein